MTPPPPQPATRTPSRAAQWLLALAASLALLLGFSLWSVPIALLADRWRRHQLDYFSADHPVDALPPLRGLAAFLSHGAGWVVSDVVLNPTWMIAQSLLGALLIAATLAATKVFLRTLLTRGPAGYALGLDVGTRFQLHPAWILVALPFGAVAALAFGNAQAFVNAHGILAINPRWPIPLGLPGVRVPLAFALAHILLHAPAQWRATRTLQRLRHQTGTACSRCGYALAAPAPTSGAPIRCPECGHAPPAARAARPSTPPLSPAAAGRRRPLIPALTLLALSVVSGAIGAPALLTAIAHSLDSSYTIIAPTPSVSAPLSRPVRAEGPWGQVWLLALPVPTGETLVRLVMLPPRSGASALAPLSPADLAPGTAVRTILLDRNSPGGPQALLPPPPSAPAFPSLAVDCYNLGFADPTSRYAAVRDFPSTPDRVTSFPDASQAPPEIANLLASPPRNTIEARALADR